MHNSWKNWRTPLHGARPHIAGVTEGWDHEDGRASIVAICQTDGPVPLRDALFDVLWRLPGDTAMLVMGASWPRAWQVIQQQKASYSPKAA